MAKHDPTKTQPSDDALTAELLNATRPALSVDDPAGASTPTASADGADNAYLSNIHLGSSEAAAYRPESSVSADPSTAFVETVAPSTDGSDNDIVPLHPSRPGQMTDAGEPHAVATHTMTVKTVAGNGRTTNVRPDAADNGAAGAALPDAQAVPPAMAATSSPTEREAGDAPEVPAMPPAGPHISSPSLAVADVVGPEDNQIGLDIDGALRDLDGSGSISITIAGMPPGATLSAGIDNGDGTWTLTPDQLAGLRLTPPANSDGDFTLTVTAIATETNSGATAQTVDSFNVVLSAAADAPALNAGNASGGEDTVIALDIASALTDTDGSESLSITIAGMPAGATLSAGTDNGDGSWTLAPAQLAGLTFTPPADTSGDFTLSVTATSTEAGGGAAAQTVATFQVAVSATADTPILTAQDVSGIEDTAIALNIAAGLADLDGSESLSISIAGMPAGAMLSAGTDNGDGTWTLSPAQLAGLTLTPPANGDGDFSLTVTATSTEADGGAAAQTVATFNVAVSAAADTPALTVQNALGIEDTAIALNIAAGLNDFDGSETLSITIAGMPAGATLSAGTDNGDGTWTLSPAQLAGLKLTPPLDSDGDFSLTVTATSTEVDGGEAAQIVATFDIAVSATADTPALTVQNALGNEDTAIALNIAAGLNDLDGSETLSITIAGMPAGATLSAGTDNGDGTWTLSPAQLAGLTLTPPANGDDDFSLTVTATSTEAGGGAAAQTVATFQIAVNATADTPILTVQDVSGAEDTAIALNIAAGLADLDGSESLSIAIAGMPTGATLSAGTDNGDGTWTLSPAQLAGLTLTPPANGDGDFSLTVTATSTEADGGATTQAIATFNVAVGAAADAPALTVQNALGIEDTAIALNIAAGLNDLDGSESLSITVAGMPAGAALSAGTDNGDGTWTLSPAQLAGLKLTPPANSDADFTLSIAATSSESGGGSAASGATLNVTIIARADAPVLAVQNAAGAEDVPIALDIAATLADLDGSEVLSVTIAGVPPGATLSAGTNHGDGSWSLTPAQLAGLTLTPPADSDGDFSLVVTATSVESVGGNATQTVATFSVTVSAAADAPILTAQNVSGNEDAAIALNIAAGLADIDGSETLSITIAGMPAGATLSAGTDNGDGTWTLSPAQLAGLTLTPPANGDGDFSLTVTATSTETDGGAAAQSVATFNVAVNALADAAALTAQDVSGVEDTAIALNIAAGLADIDGSEALSITVAGMPAGAVLSAGTDNGDGSWTLTPAQLAGLTFTPPADSNGDFSLTVTATSAEADGGATTQTFAAFNIVVNAAADAPALTAQNASGSEDTGIALNIAAGLSDIDGSEALSITIAGMPAGAMLSAGTDNGDGTWTLSPAQLTGLTLTPPANSDGDFNLTVTATSVEADGGAAAQTVATFGVTVDAVADMPMLAVQDGSGLRNTGIALDITGAMGDIDGSESLSITIAGVPAGAMLSAGTDDGNGTWTLSPTQLPGLTITPPAGSEQDMALTVTATSTEANGGSGASATATLSVSVFGQIHDGNNNGNLLAGGAGDDQVFGQGGNDTLYGDQSLDLLDGVVDSLLGWGDDEIHGGLGHDNAYGGLGDDRLYGDAGNDDLYGGNGNDTLDGGAGNDSLRGGDGNDVFTLGDGNDNAWGEAGNDLIYFGQGGGAHSSFNGGAGWTDAIQLTDVAGAPATGDWTLAFTTGGIIAGDQDGYDLTTDAAGTVTLADGSELTFVGVERIQW